MRSRKSQSGFTMTELLVVIALMFIISMLGIPALMNLVARTKVEGAAREATIFVQQARMEAVKINRPAIIRFTDVDGGVQLESFIDFNEDGVFSPAASPPDPRSTDRIVGRYRLVGRVTLRGAGGSVDPDPINGFTPHPTDASQPPSIVVRPDGTVDDPGSMVVGDDRSNYLRIAIGRLVKADLAKWDRDDTTWKMQDEAGDWTWY